ncbi:MAG: LapA family protein [Sphingobium sp.]|nr:LapA family protein [Sphingobium sp.]
MQFLKTAFWVVLAVVIALFSYNNWTPVTIRLWGDLWLETPLPVLVIISFLAGSLPLWVLHRISRWSMGRKLDSAERALASVKPAYPPPSPASDSPGDTDHP